MPDQPLLQIDDLAVSFHTERGIVRAVNGVNLSIYPRQTLAVVGESGSGKSVTSLSVLQLIPTPPGRYDSGAIIYKGQNLLELHVEANSLENSASLSSIQRWSNRARLRQLDKQMQKVRGAQIAMIFQEPMTSLNPVYTVGWQILEAITLHQKVTRSQAIDIATQALSDVGIGEPRRRLDEYPHQMSGGMRQRVMIAMALACNPTLLIADEPTTALDVTIQAQILELLRDLQRKRDMSVLLITHDLGVVAENADVVAVMYAGRVVEYGSVHDVFERPLHPYTQGLFRSMPVLGEAHERLQVIPGSVPNPAKLPTGCPFHPRCDAMNGDEKCTVDDPPLLEIAPGHWAACWHAPDYTQGQATRPDVTYRREAQPTP